MMTSGLTRRAIAWRNGSHRHHVLKRLIDTHIELDHFGTGQHQEKA
jgi:hypothetical protein